MSQKPSLPSGTRDFGPETMGKRNKILSTIKAVFEKYGFAPLETPTMENLSVLQGKYGEEGDQLLFKILNSGDFLTKVKPEDIEKGYKHTTSLIAEKGLRYDLTVPFARYVVMNRGTLTFPFKRYQVQPVWRGDRPQRGRYREFYQCDADVIGTDSLLCEAEIILMMNEALKNLGIKSFSIKLNNRKVLSGIAEAIGAKGKEAELCVAIDKLDKIGPEKVAEELKERGFSENSIQELMPLLSLKGSASQVLGKIQKLLVSSEIGKKGIEELQELLSLVKAYGLSKTNVEIDITLARGLSYYTGAIFEVKALGVSIGSISGGGRYDNLTGVFGVPGMSGVGFSFGIDRIYDVMEELQLFAAEDLQSAEVLVCHFDKESMLYGLKAASALRDAQVKVEVYPDLSKIKKQMDYANKKGFRYVLLAGSEEIEANKYRLKDMKTGGQKLLSLEKIVEFVLKKGRIAAPVKENA